MTIRVVRLGDSVAGVDVACAAARDWLHENLHPWIEEHASAGPDHRVEFTTIADPHRALGVDPDSPRTVERPCFALDTRVLAYPGWEAGGEVVLEDTVYDGLLRIGPSRTQVVARPGFLGARVTLLRAIREVLTAPQREAPDWIELHAAAFEVGGRTVLVMGPKEAGKTTLLLHVLSTGDARFVTNDRTLVRAGATGVAPEATGVPTFINVRPGTLAIFPHLASPLDAIAGPFVYALRELSELVPRQGPPKCDARIVMTPAQFCRQAGVAPHRGGPVAAVLLPERSSSPGAWQIDRLDRDAGRAALLANRYGVQAEPRQPTVYETLAGSRPRSEAADARLLDRILAHVPVFRCRIGATTAADPGNAARVLRALPL